MIFTKAGMKPINFDKVIISWLDINSCDNAWNTEEDLKDLVPAMCISYRDHIHSGICFEIHSGVA